MRATISTRLKYVPETIEVNGNRQVIDAYTALNMNELCSIILTGGNMIYNEYVGLVHSEDVYTMC